MKKRYILLAGVCLLAGCNNVNTESLNSQSIDIQTILNNHYVDNITYHSDVIFYYYPIGKKEELQEIQHFDTYAKITDDKFSFSAYYKGDNSLYSSFYLQNENNKVVYKSLNVKNEVESTPAMNSKGLPLSWDDSIYRNLLTYIKASDLVLQEDGTYLLDSLSTNNWLADIAACATYTSNLYAKSIESGIFKFSDDGSMSLVIQEKESDEVYENYMYGRTITINFEDVGTTSIPDFTNLPAKEENNSLNNALKKLQDASNFTYLITGQGENISEYQIEKTICTNNGIYVISGSDDKEYYGYHTYNDLVYYYSTKDLNNMIGSKVDISISSLLPSFDISSDLFTLESQDENYKTYTISTMSEVINYISINQSFSDSYYNGNNDPIKFIVDKNDNISKIIIPGNLQIISDEGITYAYGEYVVTYLDIGTSSTDSLYDNFKAEDEVDVITSWEDFRLNLISASDSKYVTPNDVFLDVLGSKDAIKFFLPKSVKSYEEVSYEESCLGFYSNSSITENDMLSIKDILIEDGFTYDSHNDEYAKEINGYMVYITMITDSGFTCEIHFEQA